MAFAAKAALLLLLPAARPMTAVNTLARCNMTSSGTNVLVSDCTGDDCTVRFVTESPGNLPSLPDTAVIMRREAATTCAYSSVLLISGMLSLNADDRWFAVSTEMRRAMRIFIDLVNHDKGGLTVGDQKVALNMSEPSALPQPPTRFTHQFASVSLLSRPSLCTWQGGSATTVATSRSRTPRRTRAATAAGRTF